MHIKRQPGCPNTTVIVRYTQEFSQHSSYEATSSQKDYVGQGPVYTNLVNTWKALVVPVCSRSCMAAANSRASTSNGDIQFWRQLKAGRERTSRKKDGRKKNVRQFQA